MEAVDFSTILPWCVTGGSAGLVKVWDLSTLATRHEFKHDAGVIKAKFVDSHAQIVVTCSVDQSIRIWDARTGNAVRKLTGHTDIVLDFAVADKSIVSCGDDGVVRLFKNCLA